MKSGLKSGNNAEWSIAPNREVKAHRRSYFLPLSPFSPSRLDSTLSSPLDPDLILPYDLQEPE